MLLSTKLIIISRYSVMLQLKIDVSRNTSVSYTLAQQLATFSRFVLILVFIWRPVPVGMCTLSIGSSQFQCLPTVPSTHAKLSSGNRGQTIVLPKKSETETASLPVFIFLGFF